MTRIGLIIIGIAICCWIIDQFSIGKPPLTRLDRLRLLK